MDSDSIFPEDTTNSTQSIANSDQLVPVQPEEGVLHFEIPKTFQIDAPTTIVKHKKFGNKKTRKVLKRINVISKLRKKNKKQTYELEESVNDDNSISNVRSSTIPTVHVESLRHNSTSIYPKETKNEHFHLENTEKQSFSDTEGEFHC